MKIAYLSLFFALILTSVQASAVNPGNKAPAISLPLLENKSAGKIISTGSYKGKLIYLDFWASWCGPCRKSLPTLNKIRKKFHTQGFEVVAINVDEKITDALRFLKKHPVDYPVLLDASGIAPKIYKVKGMPTAYLIDEKGVIIYKHVGFNSKDQKKLEEKIAQHLQKK